MAVEGHKRAFWDDGNVPYLDPGGNNTGVHIYKHPINCTLKVWHFNVRKVCLKFLESKFFAFPRIK